MSFIQKSFRLAIRQRSVGLSHLSSNRIANFHSTAKIKMQSSTSQHTNRPSVLNELSPVFTSMHDAKVSKQLTFEQIAKKLGRSEWYTAAIFYGQAKPEEKDLKGLSEILQIPFDRLNEVMGQHFFPTRGLGQFPPQDPTIYRLYECLVVYGHPLKAMIHEKFGDGIMSLIDFTGDMERVPDPAGDRVKITLNGKFLPYKRW